MLTDYINEFKEDCIYKANLNDIMQDSNKKQNEYDSDPEISIMNVQALDRNAIKSWVRNNYNKDIPSSSNSTVPYFDFSRINNAYDCNVYVTGRTSTEVYNDNQLATTIYGKQRLLHLEGNYTGR